MRIRRRPWHNDILNSNHPNLIKSPNELKNIISPSNINILEIGSGRGDFIINLAIKNKNNIYFAIEKNVPVIATTLKKLIDLKIDNLFLINMDVYEVLDHIPNNCINTIHLNFSDPWPKEKSNKRRLTFPTLLTKYKTLLKQEGYIKFKTDNIDFFNDSIEYFKSNNWLLKDINYDYPLTDNLEDTYSEYEIKFRNFGQKIHYLLAFIYREN